MKVPLPSTHMTKDDKGPMDQLSAHLDRAWDLVGKGDLAGARRSAEKSLELEPEAPEVHNLLGYVSALDGSPDEAVEHYKKAIELDESFVEAMLNAAEVYLHPLHAWDDAIKSVEDALEWIVDEDELADALLLELDAYLGKGDRDAAARVVARLPKGPFENQSLSFGVGRAHFEVGDVDTAEPLILAAAEADPANADAQYYAGLIAEHRGDARAMAIAFLRARDAELRGQRAGKHAEITTSDFEARVQAAIRSLPEPLAHTLEGALVIVCDVPGAEVVAEGVDPRIPLMLDDVSPDGEPPRAGRAFIYQRNVERVSGPSPDEAEGEIIRALTDEILHVFPELASDPAAAPN
jgi:tetratricopeptide (TPR) repeat protein